MDSKIVLRSSSPRRKAFLENLGLSFEISPLSISEDPIHGETYSDYLRRVTLSKLGKFENNSRDLYIASDTIVVFSHKLFPKPETEERNLEYLLELNGKTHSVLTGMAMKQGNQSIYEFEETLVSFTHWKEKEIKAYISKYKPMDKAGGYGIQDEKGPVKEITGSYWNVVGFPARTFYSHHKLWSRFMQ
jgi:septum formation protein